jgi:NAD(P)-dependent dehydrogenase (short-subunit alcohol dehydrogenase family)
MRNGRHQGDDGDDDRAIGGRVGRSADEGPATPEHRLALQRLRAGWGGMDGRTVLVTGATRGIGLETGVRLAEVGADVLVHGRDPGRGAAALAAVQAASAPDASPALFTADLSSLAGVRGLAAEVRASCPCLDVLVANAGVYAPERYETADGLELTFAVNAIAPILLAEALLPALRAARRPRIVILSSASHWTGELHWDDLQFGVPGSYDGIRAYDQSKLAVLMLTLALARRLRGSGVTAVCLDPGDVATTMLASGWPGLPGIPVEDGAVTSVYLASAPEVEGVSGVYYEDATPVRPLEAALDVAAQERLWDAVRDIAGPPGV